MFKTRRPIPGQPPATLTPRVRTGTPRPQIISVIEYDESGMDERTVTDAQELLTCFGNGRQAWINIIGLSNVEVLRTIGERFNLHLLSLEDVVNVGQRPKFEQHEDYLFVIVEMLYQDGAEHMAGEQVSMFLGEDFLITVQEEEYDVFNPVRARLKSGRGVIRKMKTDYLAYALLDCVIDHYFPVLENIGTALEGIEDELTENPTSSSLQSLHEYKRTLMQIRRFTWPARDVMTALLHDESGFIHQRTRVFLRDCYDHTVQVMDLVENYRDFVSSLTDLYLSSVSIRTNEIMRVLTVIASIFIPLTFIVGIYGMNFAAEVNGREMPLNMPELYQPYGYLGVMLFMALIAAFQLIIFRKKKWL